MSARGRCNCGSVSVELTPEQRASPLLCHCCNCARAGGAYSVNYIIDDKGVEFHDAQSTMKTYEDRDTVSGNLVLRRFCGNCGSPVFTTSPQFPGKYIVKASLFEEVSTPATEIYTGERHSWAAPIESAVQK